METCLAHWNDREMQLVRLHEEILSKREALLNCSISYHQSQELRSKQWHVTSEEAYVRNHTLLQDIRKTQTEAFDSLNSAPSPRFMTLQKNYWAMVRSQVPMWEQDLGFVQAPTSTRSAPTHREGTPGAGRQPVHRVLSLLDANLLRGMPRNPESFHSPDVGRFTACY